MVALDYVTAFLIVVHLMYMKDTTELLQVSTQNESLTAEILAMGEKFIASMDLTPQEANNMKEFGLIPELVGGFQEGALEMSEEQENATFARLIEGLQHDSE